MDGWHRKWGRGCCKTTTHENIIRIDEVLCNERSKSSTTILDKSSNLVSGKKEVQARWTEVLNREEPTDPITMEDECEYELVRRIDWRNRDHWTNNWRGKSSNWAFKEWEISRRRLHHSWIVKGEQAILGSESASATGESMETWKDPGQMEKRVDHQIAKEGKPQKCKNWRRITLFSVVGKILGRVVIDRIQNGVDITLRNEQAGYRKGRGTTEQIFISTEEHHWTSKRVAGKLIY